MEEQFDVLNARGELSGETAARSKVHAEGLLHRAVHVWLWCPSSGEVLLQERAACKDSWPCRWDVSSAGHVSAGGIALDAAVRELEEELGVAVPPFRLRFLFTHLEKLESIQKGRRFVNNEFNEIFVLEIDSSERLQLNPAHAVLRDLPSDFAPAQNPPHVIDAGFSLQRSEVSAVMWVALSDAEKWYREADPRVVPCTNWPSYGRIFKALRGEEVSTVFFLDE